MKNIPSFRPTPDLKLKIHARSALNGKNKAVAFDHGDGKKEGIAIRSGHPAKSKKAVFTGNSPLKTTSTTALSRYSKPSATLLQIATK